MSIEENEEHGLGNDPVLPPESGDGIPNQESTNSQSDVASPPQPEATSGVPSMEVIRASYENALNAAKKLKELGVEDPLEAAETIGEDSPMHPFFRAIEEWEMESGLDQRGIDSTEKAEQMVRFATLYISAGYTENKFIEDALEKLRDEYADARNRPGSEEVRRILIEAISALEGPGNVSEAEEKAVVSKERSKPIPEKVAIEFSAAMEFLRAGDLKSAAFADARLTSILSNPVFKMHCDRHSTELESQIRTIRDGIRTAVRATRAGGDPEILKEMVGQYLDLLEQELS
jgi:hypothetical protein